jgi:hypothetical protein
LRFWSLILTLSFLLAACTEVTENFAGECVPDEFKCLGKDLSACKTDGTGFEIVKSCNADAPCVVTDGVADCEEGGTVIGCNNSEECVSQLKDVGPCREVYCDAGTCRIRVQEEGTVCDDANACTEDETCTGGLCIGTLIACDDGDPCTKDSCNPLSGCTYEDNEGAVCDDGQPCTKKDTCIEGQCSGTQVNCDDGNTCTTDACDQATGECVFISNSDLCDDKNACTENDKCLAGVCAGSPSQACNDNGDCGGCGDACLGQFVCTMGVCQPDPATVVSCPQDQGPCLVNQCVIENDQAVCKALAKPNQTVCDDANECTFDDLCKNGNCFGVIDLEKEGCGIFHLQSWSFTSGNIECKNNNYTLRAILGSHRIVGESTNSEYTLRIIAP